MDRFSAADVLDEPSTDTVVPPAATRAETVPVRVPDYLRDVYAWAYLRPRSVRLLDRKVVTEAILWGNYRRLSDEALAEFAKGASVLQPACAYGDIAQRLARHLGREGRLEVADVAPIQLDNVQPKLAAFPQASLVRRDGADTPAARYDGINCFFLLHEIPAAHRARVVDALLAGLTPGGKAVFVDYHRPLRWHPLRPVMSAVFDWLEPFAKGLWRGEIRDMAQAPERFAWRKTTYFGGLYQKVVAVAR